MFYSEVAKGISLLNNSFMISVSLLLDVVLLGLFAYNLVMYAKTRHLIKDELTRNILANMIGLLTAFSLTFFNLWLISLCDGFNSVFGVSSIDALSVASAMMTNITLLCVACSMYYKSKMVGFEA